MKPFLFLFSSLFPTAHAQSVNLINQQSAFYNLENLTMNSFIQVGVNLAFGIAGILAFLYLMLGGIQWITGSGDKDSVEKARRRIIQALIGLAIIFFIYMIVNLIGYIFHINILSGNLPNV